MVRWLLSLLLKKKYDLTTMSNIFVTAATGPIGPSLIPLLFDFSSTKQLIILTSSTAKPSISISGSPLITIVQGLIQNPVWVERQLTEHQIDTVFLSLYGADELLMTVNFFSAVQCCACVKHLVYLSVCGDFSLRAFAEDLADGWMAEHALVKVMAE